MKQKKYPLYEQKPIYTVRELVACFRSFDNKTAFISHQGKEKKEISYSEFVSDIVSTAQRLKKKVPSGAHIALLGENSYYWVVCYLAVIYGGFVAVPLDTAASAHELKTVIEHSDTKLVLYSREFFEDIAHLPCQKSGFEELLTDRTQAKNAFAEPQNILDDPDRLAAILYTSGSTGTSKGVMLSQKNIVTNVAAMKRQILAVGTSICVLPLHHAYSLSTGTLAVLLSGCCIHVGTRLSRLEKDMREIKPDFLVLVPVIIEGFYKKIIESVKASRKQPAFFLLTRLSNFLLRFKIDKRRVFFKDIHQMFGGSLQWIGCGGAVLSDKIIRDFRSWGIEIICAYGLTECSPVAAANRNRYNVIGSAGTAVSSCEIKTDGSEPFGEILVKGTNVMLGYYKDKEATEKAFQNGWFRTGDLGYIDKNGSLYLTGRKKNLIILSNGKNVSPEELEGRLLSAIPEISEVIVFEENQKIAAEIFLKQNSENARAIVKEKITRINRELASYQRISVVHFRETAFEKTSTQKIKRK